MSATPALATESKCIQAGVSPPAFFLASMTGITDWRGARKRPKWSGAMHAAHALRVPHRRLERATWAGPTTRPFFCDPVSRRRALLPSLRPPAWRHANEL